uniref:TLC domain-containing protein n=1 Tax=Steinernema glaseri TaxID=37863 RepID=A0A1I7YLA1_9BILA
MNIWHESFWLPEGVHWKDLQSTPTVQYPDASDFRYTIYFGIALLVLRILVESLVFLPIGYLCGWIVVKPETGGLRGRIVTHLKGGFAGKSKFKRIAETAWRCCFYICAWTAGFFILRNEAHLYNVTECWKNWPHHPISNSMWWYYIIETAFYWALLFSTVFFDIRRHDFIQMMLHHGITILLLGISFSMNMVRVGSLVLFSHDLADIFLDLGKLFNYAKWELPLKIIFATFMVVWIGTRLVYYPGWIIHSVIFEAPEMIQKSYRWENLLQRPIVPRLLAFMLCALLVLHFFWTWLILKIAVKTATQGEVNDVRESDDDDESTHGKED